MQKLKTITVGMTAVLLASHAVFAASQTWTNAPVNNYWTNAANWIGLGVPGVLNQTGNSVNNDVATFNSPVPLSGIGGAGSPILIDDATVLGARSRTLGSIIFDSGDCGPYVFSSLSPASLPSASNPETGILNLCHNGSIRINALVTNSQVFLVPVQTRLPSSTAGIYNFINDAANAAVTLTLTAVTNDSANTRGTDFRLGGTNTGANTIGALSAGTTTTGANGLTKLGSGRWILTGDNDFRAQTVVRIQEGTLEVNTPGAFSGVSASNGRVTVTNTGILWVNGTTLLQTSLRLHNGAVFVMNGSGSVNGVEVGNSAGTQVTLRTVNAGDVLTVGTGVALDSVVSGGAADTVLNTTGPGTVQLATGNTYVGNWALSAATNQLISFPFASARNVQISAGAVLDTSLLGSYSLESLSLSANGTGTAVGSTAATIQAGAGNTFDVGNKNITLAFAPTAFSGDTTHPALYVASGAIALNGNFFTVNNTSGTPLGVGTYRLIQQASGSVTVSGGPFAVVLGAGLAAGTIGDIVVSGGNVDLMVSAHVAASLNWQGGNPDNVWDSLNTANWNNGVGFAQFGNGDSVTFGPLGASFPSVNIAGTELPSSVLVDTSANDYTFTGAGLIAGPTALTKVSTGILTVQTANAYLGGTTISNGTLRVGVENAIPSAGSGNVAAYGSSVIDLNGFNNTVNGLSGNGTIDNQSASPSILTVGNNNATSSFAGLIKNTSSTLGLAKVGAGALTLPGANTYAGPTTLNAGTLVAGNLQSLGNGSDLTINAGTLNIQTDLAINSLAGTGGTIANNSSTTTNLVIIGGTNDTVYGGNVVDGSGGGGVGIRVLGGSLTMSGNNTYTGGTYVGSGATFAIPNAPAAVGGFVVASNGATLNLSGGSGTPGTPNSVTTVDGATVYFRSGAEGKIWQAQFHGSLNTTNRILDPMSAGQELSFADFHGVVELANTNSNSNFRFFNGGGISGGEDTLFVFERCNVHTRDSQTVRLGAIAGGNNQAGIGDQAGTVSWEIGAKNTSMAFHGYLSGVNNSFVKVGTGVLTLDGRLYYTNSVALPDASVVDYTLFTNALSYLGSTTVSNGTLAIVAPNNLTTSSNLTMAGGVLDATQIGSYSNQTTLDINSIEQPTNTVPVITGLLQILAGQTLNGFGSILGDVSLDAVAINNVGDSITGTNLVHGIGTLAVNGSLALNGTVNLDLNRSNSGQNSDRLTAITFTGSGATLNVSVSGPTLIAGTTFQLFNQGVTVFTTINLPATDSTGQINYTWQNDIASSGSITLLSGLSATPTQLTSSVSGGGTTLDLSWPADHRGWTLQSQTNSLNVGITSTWYDVPGSTTNVMVTVPLSPANPTVFYRLTLPLP